MSSDGGVGGVQGNGAFAADLAQAQAQLQSLQQFRAAAGGHHHKMASFSFPNMLPNMMAANMMGMGLGGINLLQQQQQQPQTQQNQPPVTQPQHPPQQAQFNPYMNTTTHPPRKRKFFRDFSFLFSRRFLFAMCGADPEPHSQLCRPDNAELTYLLIQDAATIR